MTREEVKKKVYEKKVKKALKSYRFRPFKNFVFWFAGVLSSVAVVAGAIFVGIKVVPIKTYTAGKEEGYVSEEIASKSILDVLLNYNKYGLADIPGIRDSLVNSIAGSIAGNYITINSEKLNAVKFDLDKDGGQAMIEGLLNSITFNPEGLALINEGIVNLSIFNEYQEAQTPGEKSEGGELYILDTNENNPKLYYYEVDDSEQGGGSEGLSAGLSTQAKKYARAYDDNGKRLAPNGVILYYPALKDVPILDITQMLDKFIERIDIGEVLDIVLPTEGENEVLIQTLVNALKGETISNIDSLATNLLSKFTIGSFLGENSETILSGFSSLSLFSWENEVDDSIFDGKLDGDGNIIKEQAGTENEVNSLNPALFYYYDATEEKYLRAFDDEGQKLYSANYEKLYYPNLLEVSISDLTNMVSGLINIVDFGEVLDLILAETLNNGKDNQLLKVLIDALNGKGIGDLDNIANDLLSSLTLKTVLGENFELGDLASFSLLDWGSVVDETEFEGKVDVDGNIIKDEADPENIVYALNPALYYYYDADAQEYLRAFDNDGLRLVDKAETLYYANLLETPISDLMTLVDEIVNLIDVGEILSVVITEDVINGSQNPELLKVLVSALSGKGITDLGDIAGDLLAEISLYDLLGDNGLEALAGFTNLDALNWGSVVDETEFDGNVDKDGNIIKDETDPENIVYALNPALYYYYDANAQEYLRAFDNDGVRVEKAQDETLFYANLLEVPIGELLSIFGARFEKLELLDVLKALQISFDEGSIIDILLEGLSIKDLTKADTLSGLLNKLTISSLGIDLGAFSQLSVFNEWEEVAMADMPIGDGETQILEGFNPKLYYYVANPLDVDQNGKLNDTAYVRAFNDDGSVTGEFTTLYYAKLFAIGFTDMAELMQIRFGSIKAVDLLENFGGAQLGSDSIFSLVLGDKTINQLGDITSADIYLHWVLPFDSTTKDTYKLILNGLNITFDENDDNDIKAKAQSITTSMLAEKGIEFNNVRLSQFIDANTLNLLCTAINGYRDSDDYAGNYQGEPITSSTITVGDMGDFSIDYIPLKEVMGDVSADIKDLICQLVGETNFNKITINDLSIIEPNRISLGKFITNDNTLNLIREAINAYRAKNGGTEIGENDIISVGDMADFDTDYVPLSVFAEGMSDKVKTMVCQLVGEADFEKITVDSLASITNFDGVKLDLVLSYEENKLLYKILMEATTNIDTSDMSDDEIKAEAEQLSISSLGGFNVSNIRISSFLTDVTPELKKVIQEITKIDDFNDIKVSDLNKEVHIDNINLSVILGEYDSDNQTIYNILLEASGLEANAQNANSLKMTSIADFDFKNVRLSTALNGPTGNKILDALRSDSSVNLGNIGEAVNNISLYKVFGEGCFTNKVNEAINDTDLVFELVENALGTDADGNPLTGKAFVHVVDVNRVAQLKASQEAYYIHKNDGIWLLLCFESGDVNKDGANAGRPEEYFISSNTLGDLINSNSQESNFISDIIEKATLRQLMDAGMINSVKEKLYTLTLNDLISIFNGIPDNVLDGYLN